MLHKDERTNRRLFSCPWKMRNVRKIESLTLAQWNQVILCSRTWIFCTASISRDFFQLSVLKYGFLKKLFLYQWTSDQLNIFSTFLSSKLDSLVIKTLERHSLNLKKCLSNALIMAESNFDEKKGFNCPEFHS